MEAPGSPSNEADQELEAELERQMMADAKPDALVEAVEDTRPVPRKRASPEDDDGDQPKPPRKRREGPKKTFAGRIMPKEVFAKQRFESIRDAFELYCLPRLKKPSTHAVPKLQNNRMVSVSLWGVASFARAIEIRMLSGSIASSWLARARRSMAWP